MDKRKRVAVLGSTGSIGTSTLDVIAANPGKLQLAGIAARSRIDALASQIATYRPPRVAVVEAGQAKQLAALNTGVDVLSGIDGMTELATHPDVDVVVVGTSGTDTLRPLLRAIQAGKQIAFASKELLVMAGELVMAAVREHEAVFLPVDSEHAALFQALRGVPREQLAHVTITGSGGPLWAFDRAQIESVTRAQVLNHPKWDMGPKITVDSATLMNKGLEVIEARWLFDLPLEQVRVVIHPQALIHAIVELVDGSCLAQMSVCDMRLPIQAALSYPDRWPMSLPKLRWTELSGLQFFDPDPDRFPCFRLALDAAAQGGSACAVLSVANETAVGAYLREELPFAGIPAVIEGCLERRPRSSAHPTLDNILELDQWTRDKAKQLIADFGFRIAA